MEFSTKKSPRWMTNRGQCLTFRTVEKLFGMSIWTLVMVGSEGVRKNRFCDDFESDDDEI